MSGFAPGGEIGLPTSTLPSSLGVHEEVTPHRGFSGSIPSPSSSSVLMGASHQVQTDIFIEKDKDILSFEGFRAPLWKSLLYCFVALISLGISLLLCKWSPSFYILLSLKKCKLVDAQFVRVTLIDGRVDLQRVSHVFVGEARASSSQMVKDGREGLLESQGTIMYRLLEYRCHRYFFVDALSTFVPVPAIPKDFNDQLQKTASQLSATGHAHLLHAYWDVAERQTRYGPNEMRLPVKSIPVLIFESMWHPFYVFQYASVILWVAAEAYYSYSVCIFVITAFSIITEAVESHNNAKSLSDMAYYAVGVEVLRNGQFQMTPSPELVPGDILLLSDVVLPCDVVLLRGECIVDENMLTGESVPVRKVPYSPVADGLGYGPDKDSRCTLFSGTRVAQARGSHGMRAVGMVCRTGFYSAKGQLLRSILFPKELQATFIRDSLVFIGFMLIICLALFIWSAVALTAAGADPIRIGLRFLDMITIAVPPALPACLTIATVFSIGRLRKKDIYVTGPDRITLAGQLDVVCFDKTGTLTEQGLHLQGVLPVSRSCFDAMEVNASKLSIMMQQLLASCHGLARLGTELVGDPLDQILFGATHWELIDEPTPDVVHVPGGSHPAPMPTAASDHHMEGSGGEGINTPSREVASAGCVLTGSPSLSKAGHQMGSLLMETHVKTFVRPPGSARSYGIIRRFEFSAALLRNVVVVESPDGSTTVFAKGSPEMIRRLVNPSSIPSNFDAVLGGFTKEGLRVLALAMGDASEVPHGILAGWTQEQTEEQVPLELVGLAVMDNPLRPCSSAVIQELQDANIRTVMVTGDHVRTAISIAHLCGICPISKPICMVDASEDGMLFKLSVIHQDGELSPMDSKAEAASGIMTGELSCAVTGKGFDKLRLSLDPDLLPATLHHASVFARMSPDNKRDLMQFLGNGLDGVEGCPHLGVYAGFCGDGANDCGALKAAHVGVSLCEAEASVAAPMTSKLQSIRAMVTVISEGRCSLMATYQIFQFIIGCALVQAFSTNLMYTYALNVGNYQYLIQDLFFTTVLAGLMGYTEARATLSSEKPVDRVVSLPIMTATLLQLSVAVLFQLLALYELSRQEDYERAEGDKELRVVKAPENTVTYLMALAQYIILAVVFNKGKPHRQPLYTNYGLTASIILQVGFVLYSLYSEDKFNENVQELVDAGPPVDYSFRTKLLFLMLINFVAALLAMAASPLLVRLIWRFFPPKLKPIMFGVLCAAPPIVQEHTQPAREPHQPTSSGGGVAEVQIPVQSRPTMLSG